MTWNCAECGSENSDETTRCTCGHAWQVDDLKPKTTSRKSLISWIGVIVSMCGIFYCFLGYAMVASFAVAAPERKTHYESMAWLYIAGITICSLLVAIFGVSIFRKRSNNE